MTIDEAMENAKQWRINGGQGGWRVACGVLADEVESLRERVKQLQQDDQSTMGTISGAGEDEVSVNAKEHLVAETAAAIMDSLSQVVASYDAKTAGADWWAKRSDQFGGRVGLYNAIADSAVEVENQMSTDDWEASGLYEIADWIAAELVSDTFTGNIVPLLIEHVRTPREVIATSEAVAAHMEALVNEDN